MNKQDLLDAALDYIKTKAGKKALGVGLDINQLKIVTQAAKSPETKEVLKDRLKSYIPTIENFRIENSEGF